MKQFLTSYFAYNYQTNQSLSERFKSYEFKLDDEIVRMANHILNAHQIWLGRISGNGSLKSPWEIFPLDTFQLRNQKLFEETIPLINFKDLEEVIEYKSFAGIKFEKKLSDILIHVVNHSTYHRGQLAMMMRTNGLEPISSDYIQWASK